jgi:putative ABC transport system permease protein
MNDFTLVRKNLFRRKLRAILLIIVIFIAFLIFGVLAALQSAFDAPAGSAGANRLVVNNKINFTQPLPLAYVQRVAAIPGVEKVSHNSWFGGFYQEPRNALPVFAVDPVSYLAMYPDLKLSPAATKLFTTERSALLVGSSVAERFGLKEGQRIALSSNIYSQRDGRRSWDFVIAGIVTGEDNAPSSIVLLNYDYFNESRSFGRDSIGQVLVKTTDPSRNDAVMAAIDAQFANSPNETSTVTEEAFAKAFVGQLGNISLIITLVVSAAFVTILLIVGNTLVAAIRERTKEIAVFKTLGFSNSRILKMVLSESILLTVIGGLLGMAAAFAAVKVLQTILRGTIDGVTMGPLVWAQGVGIMVALGLITGAIPAFNAMRLNIVTALGRK